MALDDVILISGIKKNILMQSFYSGMRSKLNLKHFQKVCSLANEFTKPIIWGKFSSDNDYLKAVEIFIQSTDETRHRGIFFLRNILPRITHKQNILDVGSGNGELTRWISRNFQELTIVDPNKEALNNFTLFKLKQHQKIVFIQNSISAIKLESNHFDLILLSHVLYHLPRDEWLTTINNCYSALRKDGILVVVLNDGLDRNRLIHYFGGETHDVDELANECNELISNKSQYYISKEIFSAFDIKVALIIASICLHDAGLTANNDDFTGYIRKFYNENNRMYQFEMEQKFIVLSK